MQIRPYVPSDIAALYQICLETGDSGADATLLYQDPKLLGHFYAAPYAVLEPELCFVLEDELGVCGYVIATSDSLRFQEQLEREWLPALRQAYPMPDPQDQSRDAAMIRLIHKGYQLDMELYRQYPAHLHIDLLARAQKKGQGKRLMQRLFAALRQKQVVGVHLGVGSRNQNGIAFYKHIGFSTLQTHPWGLFMGYRL
ncbi:MAG: GNAT family N-acetyltransferase [Deinococcales bacterium]